MNEHLRAATRGSARPGLVGPVAAALVVTVLCTPALDGEALPVLRGAALLLAVALAAATDEPLARLLDAAPTPWAERVGARLVPGLAVVGAAWAMVLGWAAVHGDPPVAALTLELAALGALATAVAAGLRRWWGVGEPAVHAGPALAGLYLASGQLPRPHGLLEGQPWGPPWEAAHLRWSALLLAAGAVLVLALADPATAARRPRRAAPAR